MAELEEVFDDLHELFVKNVEKTGEASTTVFAALLTLVKLLESKGVIEYDEYIIKLKEDLQESLKDSE
ncbi:MULTISPECIES: hypothetical protein [unclassified Lysinibacillus]|uniref:hypothetical protein n=1 Tax=unclassified Lysinibacillus TaxID=2636778 RepID=UPI00381B1478